ncbi:MAG: CPBP family intramembrane metalloprotease [Saprospiraceae bacterium]|nr:CPBP family intramembrane metalloprotease [Saprospiraceae bacterium]
MIDTLISAVQQVAIFSLIPLVFYLIKRPKPLSFWQYIGLTPATRKANLLALALSLCLATFMLVLASTQAAIADIMTHPKSVTGAMRQLGFGAEAILTIGLVAILKTALAEEIFFRGFLAKRLIAMTNFWTGNVIQAVIFGAIHSLLFATMTANFWFLALIFIVPTIGALIKTYLNEKLANGSIVPGWIAHASGNVLAYSYVAFLL